MSQEGQNFSPEDTLERQQSFLLNEKTGLERFCEFLESEENTSDPLSPDLQLEELSFPEHVVSSLRKARMEFRDLKRLAREGASVDAEDVPENLAERIEDQYQTYVDAMTHFERFCIAYETDGSVDDDSEADETHATVSLADSDAPTAEPIPAADITPATDVESEPPQEQDQELEVSPAESFQSIQEAVDQGQELSQADRLQREINDDYRSIKRTYDMYLQRFPKDARTPRVEQVLGKFRQAQALAVAVRNKANESTELHPVPPVESLQSYARRMEKIEASLDTYVMNLSDSEAGFEVTEDTPVTDEVFDVPLEATALAVEQAVEVDPETTVERTAEVVDYTQAEAKIRELEQLLRTHDVLTEDERGTVQWSIDNLEHQIHNQANEQKLAQALAMADSLAVSVIEHPENDSIAKRAKILLAKAQQMPDTGSDFEGGNTGVAMANMLEKLIQQYAAGEAVPQEKIQAAYKNLEQFISENERSWLRVGGMRIPQAGPDGVFGARSFRDALEIDMRNHPDLKDSPEKQAIVDQMIRLLFVVPEAGLTLKQVARLNELAKELDVMSNTIEARRHARSDIPETPAAAEQIQPKTLETNTEEGVTDEPTIQFKTRRRGDMKVTVDPGEDSGDVKITVMPKEEVNTETTAAHSADKKRDGQSEPAIDVQKKTTEGSTVDAINNSIPPSAETRAAARTESVAADSLTHKYLLNQPRYQVFFNEHDISPAAFEKTLQATIKQIDEKEIDFWTAAFDDPYNSAFSYLEQMSLADVQAFSALPSDERRARLAENQVKNEAYFAWMDMLSDMQKLNGVTLDMSFGELYAQWMLETEMSYDEGDTSASQFAT